MAVVVIVLREIAIVAPVAVELAVSTACRADAEPSATPVTGHNPGASAV